MTITGNAGLVMNQCVATSGERVEYGGLADVWSANESDQWQHANISRIEGLGRAGSAKRPTMAGRR
jgi:hypothetical protein